MVFEIRIPKLGMNVDEVTVAEWKVAQGDRVERGSPLVVLETQKTTWELEAEGAGAVQILVPEGDNAEVGQTVGRIAETEEEYAALLQAGDAAAPAVVRPSVSGPESASAAPSASRPAEGGRIRVTPVARKLAEEHGVDLARVRGTGPGGRITKEDVQEAIRSPAASTSRPAIEEGGETLQGKKVLERIPVRGVRKEIAQHLHRSLATSAQMTVMGELDMTEAAGFKAGLAGPVERRGLRITYTDLLVVVLSRALARHRDVNCTFTEEHLIVWDDINVGVAVALGAEGLIVPVVRNADQKTLGQVSAEVRDLVERAQAGSLVPDDVAGGTFTLTSLGRGGISCFQTPILNQPEAAILATGPIRDKPVVKEGRIVVAPVMPFSLTFDHRAINGYGAEQFMLTVEQLLSAPDSLLL